MFLKLRSATLLAAFAAFSTVAAAQAQAPIQPAKVAIVDFQKAVADTQEIKQAQTALEAKYRPRTQQIQTLQNDLNSIQQQLNSPNLQPDREAQLRQTGTDKQKQLQRMTEDLQSDVN